MLVADLHISFGWHAGRRQPCHHPCLQPHPLGLILEFACPTCSCGWARVAAAHQGGNSVISEQGVRPGERLASLPAAVDGLGKPEHSSRSVWTEAAFGCCLQDRGKGTGTMCCKFMMARHHGIMNTRFRAYGVLSEPVACRRCDQNSAQGKV